MKPEAAIHAQTSAPKKVNKNMENSLAFITFEKHKLPFAVFIHSINFGRQAFPEVVDLHGVARDH